MDKNELVASLTQELRRGNIVLCVLNRLQKPLYGYALVTELEENGIPMETNTLYPLLRRLEGQGLLQSSWYTDTAKPRKYYSVTPLGAEVYAALRKVWRQTSESMGRMMMEEG